MFILVNSAYTPLITMFIYEMSGKHPIQFTQVEKHVTSGLIFVTVRKQPCLKLYPYVGSYFVKYRF